MNQQNWKMSTFKEYSRYDAIGLKALIDKGEVSPQEVIESAIDKIQDLNPGINAVIHDMSGTYRQQLAERNPESPLYGIPFLLKDLGAVYKGEPLTSGSALFKNYIPDYDSTQVSRYKNTGLVVLGKTNTPELGLKGTTEPKLHGRTRNPWNTDRITGGSSGGSAAAVASGMVPIASAGDGGGSIRIPAAYCGLFGLKPGRGRMPTGPVGGDLWQGATTQHVLSRTVRDSAFLMDLTHGMDPGSRNYALPYPGSYLQSLDAKVPKYRFAFTTDSPIGLGVHEEHKAAVLKTVAILESMGHEVTEAAPPIDGIKLAKSYLTMYMGEVKASLLEAKDLLGKKPSRNDVELETWFLARLGEITSAGDFVMAIRFWDELARKMQQFFDNFDFYITPTTAYPAAKIGELDTPPGQAFLIKFLLATGATRLLKSTGSDLDVAMKNLKFTPFTQLANLAGLPAMSVPMASSTDGMPIGVQFIAPFSEEERLFMLAGELERSQPWQLLPNLYSS